MHLYFLHGNLQTFRVWDFAKKTLPGQHTAPDLWATLAPTMHDWATTFCQKVRDEQGPATQRVLIGYSMGGRLAMQALLKSPELWTGVVLISAHPGSTDSQQCEKWKQHDEFWASRFRSDTWNALIRDWGDQKVFAGKSFAFPPQESDFDREIIAQSFLNYSKGGQEDFLPGLSDLKSPPILYISGEMDAPYCQIGETLAKKTTCVEHVVVSKAAHRVPWEEPEVFLAVVKRFLANL